MEAIGGYFELELNPGEEYYPDAIRLNTGRNALEYILTVNQYKKIYFPYFTCDVLLQPIRKTGIEYEFYHIDHNLEPVFDYSVVGENDCFLYTNYFGLKDEYLTKLSKMCKNLVIDNAQAFYSRPVENIDTFYSPRKFFGLPDGAYLYSNKKSSITYSIDQSFERFDHLLRRIDQGAEAGYQAFIINDNKLNDLPILQMSAITKKLLRTIDYGRIADNRISNYRYLDSALRATNKLKLGEIGTSVPMVYPYWGTAEMRTKLQLHKIFTAKYWPNVQQWVQPGDLEAVLLEEVIYLPIDQRQSKTELDSILKLLI